MKKNKKYDFLFRSITNCGNIFFYPGMTSLNAIPSDCFISIYRSLLYAVSENLFNLQSDSRSLSEQIFHLFTLYEIFLIRKCIWNAEACRFDFLWMIGNRSSVEIRCKLLSLSSELFDFIKRGGLWSCSRKIGCQSGSITIVLILAVNADPGDETTRHLI